MGSIEPSPRDIQAFLEATDESSPIVMINLLRYREQAAYSTSVAEENAEPCTGREAYARYGQGVAPLLAKVGARLVFGGSVASTVIAPADESWDDAVLVEYPSRNAFIEMTSSADYQAISFHRTAALADSRLIATTPGSSPV